MPLSGMALREAVANAPTIHELADCIEELLGQDIPNLRLRAMASELVYRARAVPKQPLRY